MGIFMAYSALQVKLALLMPARIAERDVIRLVVPPCIFPVEVEASTLGASVREVES
jgi:hypothetical protein